jgi:hypothetical protein
VVRLRSVAFPTWATAKSAVAAAREFGPILSIIHYLVSWLGAVMRKRLAQAILRMTAIGCPNHGKVMGQAKRRGTREQRIAAAVPKVPKHGAEQRQREQVEAIIKGVGLALWPIRSLLSR